MENFDQAAGNPPAENNSNKTAYVRRKVSCINCHSEMAVNMLPRHHVSKQCLSGGKFVSVMEKCKHCDLSYSGLTTSEKINHTKGCLRNPKTYDISGGEGKKRADRKPISEETRQKIRDGLKRAAAEGKMTTRAERSAAASRLIKREYSQESKNKMSEVMREVARKNPEKYSGRYNRGFAKKMECSNGMIVIGSWEKKFVEFCSRNQILVEQPLTPVHI